MNSVVPGHGGNVRPCEYFDLIGGTGLSGLCALLFARFVRATGLRLSKVEYRLILVFSVIQLTRLLISFIIFRRNSTTL
jgi:hypothetical protein